MNRLILLAGAATIAMATAATAGPGGDHGDQRRGGPQAAARGGGGGGHAQVAARVAAPRFAAGGGARANFQRPQQRAFAFNGGARARAAVQRPQQANHAAVAARAQAQVHAREAAQMHQHQMQANRVQQAHAQQQQRRAQMAQAQHAHAQQAQAQQHMRAQEAQAQQQHRRAQQAQAQQQQHMRAQQAQAQQQQRMQQARAQQQQRIQQAQAQRMQAQNQMAARQQMQANRQLQMQNQMAARQQLQAQRMAMGNRGVGYGVGGCPPGLADKGCMPPSVASHEMAIQNRLAVQQQLAGVAQLPVQQRVATIQSLGPNRFTTWGYAPQTQILDPVVASDLVGVPIPAASGIVPLGALPQSISYLYPQTPQYYYQYSPGYVYQVDRSTSLIDALIPLIAGGYMPGSYLPQAYMSSYTPDYYGYSSFYPASYGAGYGGYGAGLCNRYAYGVVYQVDCASGMVENEIPTYAGGYGVGQMLPSAYSYYNVPYQYRSLYPETADTGYWYAPGAIYQYDPSSSLITSVAALLSPGLTVGQALPAGYDTYNVPYGYRSTYYDTASAWYRYNNGNIYQVDPATQLVTAVVASALS